MWYSDQSNLRLGNTTVGQNLGSDLDENLVRLVSADLIFCQVIQSGFLLSKLQYSQYNCYLGIDLQELLVEIQSKEFLVGGTSASSKSPWKLLSWVSFLQ